MLAAEPAFSRKALDVMGNFEATQQDNQCLLKMIKSSLCFSQRILNNIEN